MMRPRCTCGLLFVAGLLMTFGPARSVNADQVVAVGGDEVFILDQGLPYRAHVFNRIGQTNFSVSSAGWVDLLVVGGGGGGGETIGGGGGGGGVIYSNAFFVTVGEHAVTVGGGGAGGWGIGYPPGVKGHDSVFSSLTAIGGGAGAGFNLAASGIGGSAGGNGGGGGARAGYTAEQGNDGGVHWSNNAGGGGGGAGEAGTDGSSASGGKGGDGRALAISGVTTYYGGGGGGGTRHTTGPEPGGGGLGGGGAGGRDTVGQDGLPGTGGGGGGGGYVSDLAGGAGGSGLVIVRYQDETVPFIHGAPFVVGNPKTGSTRFTNTNEVEIVDFSVPEGCDTYQINASGDPANLDPGGWVFTNDPPTIATFALPAADTNVTLYAWFTNAAESVWLHRAESRIVYATLLPEVKIWSDLKRGIVEGETVAVLTVTDIDAGSTGGVFGETELDVIGRSIFCAADTTPGLPEVTLDAFGAYEVILTVSNEAGNVVTATSKVSVVSPGTYTYYVDIDNTGHAEAPYTSWMTAATSIQDAVHQAEAGLDIASGVYSEVIVADGHYPLNATLVMADAITVRSVNGRSATVIDGRYPVQSNRCVFISGNVTLDGFTVSNGYALATGDDLADSDPKAHRRGGGIYVHGAAARILNCDIVRNRSAALNGQGGEGAGLALVNAHGTVVSNCLIAGNDTMREGSGTGLYMLASDALVDRCIISDNVQTGNSGSGGGFRIYSGVISNSLMVGNYASRYGANRMDGGSIIGCVVSNNWGRSAGGGVEMYGGFLADSILVDNRSGSEGGGGLHLRGGTATGLLIVGNTTTGLGGGVRQNRGTLLNSVVIGNHADGSGGGLYVADHTVRNCLFAGNSATAAGGGVYRGAVSTGHTLQSCTIVRNRAGTSGGGVYVPGVYANVFRNVIVAYNQAGGSDNDADGNDLNWKTNFQHSRAADLTDGVNGNLAADPYFRKPGSGFGLDALLGDYMLVAGSPCINAGVNQTWMTGATDILGDPRIQPAGGTVSMGAYETIWNPPKGSIIVIH